MTGTLEGAPTIAEGFVDLVSGEDGRLLLGIRQFNVPFLLRASIASGLGSSGLRLDRGSPGSMQFAEFRRVGNRIVLVELNKRQLATGDEAAARAGSESFATSVLWSQPVGEVEAGVFLVDAGTLAAADRYGIIDELKARGQGDYSLVESLSFPLLDESRASESGTRVGAALTFRGPGQGPAVQGVVPDPHLLTLVQHLSFVPLPDPAMPARRYHPGSGGYGLGYQNHGRYGVDVTDVRLQPRYRLEPLGEDGSGPVRRPVVFLVDPAIPEPVRSAVVEGGNWWREAFERIGFPDAYRVEVADADTDLHELGANVIWWVHRAGRGWSQGSGLTDPRTGEILTGQVRLGSQRVEQVTKIFESLLAPYGREDETARREAVREGVLARMRHLAAHEIGHALGFMHNYASTAHPKPSIMDYPHPRVRVGPDGRIDISHAYSEGLGPWDQFLVAHAYGRFPADEEDRALAELRREAAEAGLVYVADDDGQAPDSSHADGVPWTVPGDPFVGLDELLEVRRVALAGFSASVAPPDSQAGELEERAAIVHLLHRHQVEAVARLVGGVRYRYRWAGEPGAGVAPVDAGTQRLAVDRLAELLRAEHLAVPAAVLDVLSPPGIRYGRSPEYLDTRSGRIFDPVSAAEAAAALVTQQLLEPSRLNRAAWQHELDPASPGPVEVVEALFSTTWRRADPVGPDVVGGKAIQVAGAWVVLRSLVATLDAGQALHSGVRAALRHRLRQLARELADSGADGDGSRQEAADAITRYLGDPGAHRLDPPPRLPPGAPL